MCKKGERERERDVEVVVLEPDPDQQLMSCHTPMDEGSNSSVEFNYLWPPPLLRSAPFYKLPVGY